MWQRQLAAHDRHRLGDYEPGTAFDHYADLPDHQYPDHLNTAADHSELGLQAS